MRLYNHQFVSFAALETFLGPFQKSKYPPFIQVFSGEMDGTTIQLVLDTIAKCVAGAVMMGATTAGEMMSGVMSGGKIVIAVSMFESTFVRSYYFADLNEQEGIKAAKKILTPLSRVCIAFAEGIGGDSESFLNGFSSVRNDMVVAGGNAGDDLTFSKTRIFHGNTIYTKGIVITVFDSDVLQVHTAYSLQWTPIGKMMTITKADKNVVYEIDGVPVGELYTYYLTRETVERIPASAIEFPLVKMEEGVMMARSLVAQTEDGGFVYAGHFQPGDKVRFAIGNIEDILNNADDVRRKIASAKTEATFIYSCSVRKLFLKEQINYEFGKIEQIAPTAGFFTYGEFYHTESSNRLLNITTTCLSLSEGGRADSSVTRRQEHEYRHTMLKSLTHLMNKTQGELDDSIKILDQYKMVLDESSIVSKTDARGIITYVNDSFCKISGYNRDELIGQSHNVVRHPDTPDMLFSDLWTTVSRGEIWKETFKNRSKSGGTYYVKTVIAPIFDDSGMIVEYIAARVDVTELIVKEQIIQRQLTDSLTGLKNRTALFNDLENGEPETTLVILNIDRFSAINDYYGYAAGDNILKLFADRLHEFGNIDHLYRISGDEFVIMCSKKLTGDDLRDYVVEHINNLENLQYDTQDYQISLNVSAGIAHSLFSDVYNLAHMALKEAKERQAKFVFFNENMALTEKTRNNIWMVNKIKAAINEDRIVPYFQGIVDNQTLGVVKYESLIRLIETDGTVLSPYWFLEHAKKAKLYEKLTQIMIEKTFAVFEKLAFEFSINLTVQDIVSRETRELIYQTIEHSFAAPRVVFELVETEGIVQYGEVEEFIRTVKRFGCKIAIDDFGSGYSNFSYLSRLDVDYIKIDGSLIKNINHDMDHLYTVQSILYFARLKGIKTIAEFVEDKPIHETIKELGIDFSQGYLFSIPGPHI